MKTRFVVSMCAVGALLATQGLVGCGSDGSSNNGTGGVKSTGGAVSTGGVRSTGGTVSTGGTTAAGGAGGSTTPRDAGLDGNRDSGNNDVQRDTQNRDVTQSGDVACGGAGEACCANNGCDNGLTCQGRAGSRTCETAPAIDGGRLDAARNDAPTACGGNGEACCANDACDNGLTCQGNRTRTCRAPAIDGGAQNDAPVDAAPCGAEGEACCSNNTCDNGLTCQGRPGNRTCETAADGGGTARG